MSSLLILLRYSYYWCYVVFVVYVLAQQRKLAQNVRHVCAQTGQLVLVYSCVVTRRGTVIGIDIDRAAPKIDIYCDRGAASCGGSSINYGLGLSCTSATLLCCVVLRGLLRTA